jgi:hypothetical protein
MFFVCRKEEVFKIQYKEIMDSTWKIRNNIEVQYRYVVQDILPVVMDLLDTSRLSCPEQRILQYQ